MTKQVEIIPDFLVAGNGKRPWESMEGDTPQDRVDNWLQKLSDWFTEDISRNGKIPSYRFLENIAEHSLKMDADDR